jgi:hypothetical protein
MFLAWKRSDAAAISVVSSFTVGGVQHKVESERPPTHADIDDVVKQTGWHGHIVYPVATDEQRVRGKGVPTDEDYVALVPVSRRSEFRKYLAGVRVDLYAAVPTALVPPKTLALPDLVQKVRSGVVNVRAGSNGGTGFIVDGWLYTCAHVVHGAKSVEYENRYGVHGSVTRVHTIDTTRDLAQFWIGQIPQTLSFGHYEQLSAGSDIAVVGDPMGLDETVTKGIVSAKRETNGVQMLQLSTPVAPGSSGSPVFDMRGQVVGMVQSRLTNEHAYAFALGGTELAKGWVGVALSDLGSGEPPKIGPAGIVWAPDEAKKWRSEFRSWASSSLKVLQGIDIAGLGYGNGAGAGADAELRLLNSTKAELAATVGLAERGDALADEIDKSPESVLYWFQAYDFISSLGTTLSGYSTQFDNPAWTGVPSIETRTQWLNLSTSGKLIQGAIYPKLVVALGYKPSE